MVKCMILVSNFDSLNTQVCKRARKHFCVHLSIYDCVCEYVFLSGITRMSYVNPHITMLRNYQVIEAYVSLYKSHAICNF